MLLIPLPVNKSEWHPGHLDLYSAVVLALFSLLPLFLDKLDGSVPVD